MSQNDRNPNNRPDNRAPRELETRDRYVRPESWAPPEMLPMPNPQPGWHFRWVRTAVMGEDDPGNMNRARREGFEPVKASEVPEISVVPDRDSRYPDSIEVGGLLLCKAPDQFIADRTAYYAEQTRNAQQAVDNNLMKENDKRMPLFREGKSKVTFGKGE